MAKKSSKKSAARPLWRSIVILVVLIALQPVLWWQVAVRAAAVHSALSQEEQMTELDRRNADLQQSLVTQAAYLDQLEIVAPTSSGLSQIVERLEQLADDQQLTIAISRIGEADSEVRRTSRLIPMQVDAAVAGTDPSILLGYMEHIENVPELTSIMRWRLSSKPLALPPTPESPTPEVITQHTLELSILFFIQEDPDG